MTEPIPILLLTRPRPQSERFANRCRARLGRAVPILISPLLRIVPTEHRPDLTGVTGIIATSENGLQALARMSDPAGLEAWCVGNRTAEIARNLGMRARSAEGAADDLVALIAGARPSGTLLHVRGSHARGDVAARLAAAGIEAREAVLYEQVPQDLSPSAQHTLAGDRRVVLPLFSPRSARLAAKASAGCMAPLGLVSISAATLSAWSGKPPFFSAVAERPDADSMLDGIATFFPPGLA